MTNGFRWLIAWTRNHPVLFALFWSLFISSGYWILGDHSFMMIHFNGDQIISAKVSMVHDLFTGNLGLCVQ